jgi:hypothetical protein
MFHILYSLEAMYAAHYPTHNITLFTRSTRVAFLSYPYPLYYCTLLRENAAQL